ncbi:hypothetical protein [Lentzea sp. NPDC051838]|uniref:hypothetical protein n=1 Tax=Lentzea sp. NPDC051838 TaxID=3154849 RepID=UPI0034263504
MNVDPPNGFKIFRQGKRSAFYSSSAINRAHDSARHLDLDPVGGDAKIAGGR